MSPEIHNPPMVTKRAEEIICDIDFLLSSFTSTRYLNAASPQSKVTNGIKRVIYVEIKSNVP